MTGAPDFFRFKGAAFEGTTRIEGTISTALENPISIRSYKQRYSCFTDSAYLSSHITGDYGTADSIVKIEGTLAELAPAPGPSAGGGDNQDNKKRVYPYNVDIKITDTQLRYNTLAFTNWQSIYLKLVDDLWTVSTFSLTADTEQSPFLQIDGTFDAKSEKMNFRVRSPFNEDFALAPFSKAFGLPISGTANYLLHATGTLTDPRLDINWTVPTLTVQTEIGDINLSRASGVMTYRNNTLTIEPSTLLVLGNAVQVEGDAAIRPENANNSALNLQLTADTLDLAKFAEVVKNVITPRGLKSSDAK